MKPQEFFNTQKEFNQWLRQLTNEEEKHVVSMLDEYADVEANDTARQEKLFMLKKMLENDSISKENYNYYYQKYCR